MKKRLFEFMGMNSEVIDNLSATHNYAKTCNTRLDHHWATDIEIGAMASILKTSIAVVNFMPGLIAVPK